VTTNARPPRRSRRRPNVGSTDMYAANPFRRRLPKNPLAFDFARAPFPPVAGGGHQTLAFGRWALNLHTFFTLSAQTIPPSLHSGGYTVPDKTGGRCCRGPFPSSCQDRSNRECLCWVFHGYCRDRIAARWCLPRIATRCDNKFSSRFGRRGPCLAGEVGYAGLLVFSGDTRFLRSRDRLRICLRQAIEELEKWNSGSADWRQSA